MNHLIRYIYNKGYCFWLRILALCCGYLTGVAIWLPHARTADEGTITHHTFLHICSTERWGYFSFTAHAEWHIMTYSKCNKDSDKNLNRHLRTVFGNLIQQGIHIMLFGLNSDDSLFMLGDKWENWLTTLGKSLTSFRRHLSQIDCGLFFFKADVFMKGKTQVEAITLIKALLYLLSNKPFQEHAL